MNQLIGTCDRHGVAAVCADLRVAVRPTSLGEHDRVDGRVRGVSVVATPYYLIDEAALGRNLAIVDEVRERSGAKVVLALKCFSTWGVFDLIRDHVDGTTSSSLYEARLGREELGKEVHAYSVAFSGDEVRAVGELADKVIFNSITQLQAFADQIGEADVGLRFNPGISHSRYDLADPAALLRASA